MRARVPTITLTIDDDTLAALVAGEAVALQATLRRKKTKQPAALTPEQDALRRAISDTLDAHGCAAHIPKVWKDVRAKLLHEPDDDLLTALDCCLDWCMGGLEAKVAWFVNDYVQWNARARMTLMDAEDERTAWRRARGVA